MLVKAIADSSIVSGSWSVMTVICMADSVLFGPCIVILRASCDCTE
jgi:hypothetical protein